MNGVKETVIKHDTYDFFNDMINIKILDAKKKYFYSLFFIYSIYKNIVIYYIRYMTVKNT